MDPRYTDRPLAADPKEVGRFEIILQQFEKHVSASHAQATHVNTLADTIIGPEPPQGVGAGESTPTRPSCVLARFETLIEQLGATLADKERGLRRLSRL